MSVTIAKRECDRCPATVDVTSDALPSKWLQIMVYQTPGKDPFPKSKSTVNDLCPECAADFVRWALDTKAVTL